MRALLRVAVCVVVAAFLCGCSKGAPTKDDAQPTAGRPKPKPSAKQDVAEAASKPAAKPKPMKVVKEWDFTKLEAGKWEWTGRGKQLREAKTGGAYLDLDGDGAGPVLRNANVPAKEVDAVRVTFSLDIRGGTGVTEVDPDRVTLLWARSEDGKPGKGWPFADERLKHSEKPGPRPRAKAYRFNVAGHPRWNGQIEGLCVAVNVPEGKLKKGERFRIILHKIELLK